MRKRRLFIRIGLVAIVTILVCPLLCAVDSTDRQAAERAVPYQRMYSRDYRNFVGNWDEKEQPVLYALIQASAQYDALFHPAAIMPVRDTGKPRPFAPDELLYRSKQILVVARVMAAPRNGQLDDAFEVERITAKDGELTFHYRFNKPKAVRTFFVKSYLAVSIPKYNYEKAAFFENGEQVGELKLSEGQWSVPVLTPALDKSDGYASSGEKTDQTAEALLSRAMALAKTIKDFKKRWLAMDDIAVMCEEIGESDKALKYRRLALEAQVQSIQKRRFQFYDDKILVFANVAVKFAQAGQREKCVKLLNDACQMTKGIKLDARRVLTLVRLADRYTQAGEKQEAIKILSEALDELKTLKYDYRKDPDLMRWGPGILMPSLPFLKRRQQEAYVKDYIRSEIAINFAEAGEYERALEIAKGLKDLFGRTGTLEEIAYFYLDDGQYEEALNVINGIGNKIHRDDTLSHIAYKFADAGQYDYAVRSAKLITHKPLACLVLANIADKQWKAGKEDEAKKAFSEVSHVAQSMKGAGIDSADILLKISSAYIKAGQREEAIKILHQAFQIVNRTRDDHEKLSRFEAIGKQSLEVNHYDLAFQVVEALKDKHWKSMILGEAAVTYAKNGEGKKAEETLSRALQEARGIEDDSWRALTLQNVAAYYAAVGQYQKAIQIAQSIEQNIDYKNWALEKVAVKCAEGGQLERAIELAKSIKGYQRTDALNTIARYLAGMGDYDMAFKVLKGMEEGYLAKEVADILIEKYAQAGRYDRVIEVSKSTRYDRTSVAYSQIALSYAEKGQLESALENIECISSKYMKAIALAKIAVIYAKGAPTETGEGAGGKSSVTPKPQGSAGRPELEVTGIAAGTKPIAIVDGEMVREGDEIKGAKVVKIDKDAVTFEYDGEVIIKDLAEKR